MPDSHSKSRDYSRPLEKVFEHIQNKSREYEQYGTNLIDTQMGGSLKDQRKITFILPDAGFLEKFHNSIHLTGGSITKATKMFGGTVIYKYLDSPQDFNRSDFQESLPTGSGLKLPVIGITKDTVTLGGNIVIKRDETFHHPRGGAKYAIWEVTAGNFPTSTSYEPSKTKKKGNKSDIVGGSRSKFVVNIGKRLASSSDARRISLIATILGEFKASFISTREQNNALLIKGVSLYNWLSMYAPEIYNKCLPITDIHPGINLLMLILDPYSLLTDNLLFGSNTGDNVSQCKGWNNTVVTTSPHQEWVDHLNNASRWTKDEKGYLKTVQKYRRRLGNKKMNDLRAMTMHCYEDPLETLKPFCSDAATYNKLEEWYNPQCKYRKLWQDQFRLVATFGFACLAEVDFTAKDETDDVFRNMVTFRPYDNVHYDKAATFSYDGGNYQSRENDFLLSKFFMSTNFGYMPCNVAEAESLINLPCDCSGFSAQLDAAIRGGNVCNCHRIKYELFKDMKSSSGVNPELYYGIQWQLKQRRSKEGKEPDPELEKLFDQYHLNPPSTGAQKIGGDKFNVRGGRGLCPRKKDGDSSSDEDSGGDDLKNLTFFVVDPEYTQKDNVFSSEEEEKEEKKYKKQHSKSRRSRRKEESSSED